MRLADPLTPFGSGILSMRTPGRPAACRRPLRRARRLRCRACFRMHSDASTRHSRCSGASVTSQA
eukprot:11137029-Alexandrium_andersonii.AAC.1